MLNVSQILVSATTPRLVLGACVVAALAGCGQKGPLYLPSDAAAPGRLTLPQTLNPAASLPTVPASGPVGGSGTADPIPGQ